MIRLQGERSLRVAAALLALGVGACAPLPPQRADAPQNTDARTVPGVPVQERSSPNFDQRKPSLVVLHHTTNDTSEQALRTLTGRGAVLYVATSKPRVYAERIVRHFGLDAHFAAIHGCELDGTREDKRDLLAHLLPHHGVAAGEAAMIGDRGADMVAARHHGVRAIGALWGYGSRDELERSGAQSLCGRPAELAALL